MNLPIDVVPGSDPPVFRWSQLVDTPNGRQVVQHEEGLSPMVEVAVARLISVAKQLLFDNAAMHGTMKGLEERVVQLEATGKRVDTSVSVQPIPLKKGKP